MRIIGLDKQTSEYVHKLEIENEKLLKLLFQAHTELEKRDDVKTYMRQLACILKED